MKFRTYGDLRKELIATNALEYLKAIGMNDDEISIFVKKNKLETEHIDEIMALQVSYFILRKIGSISQSTTDRLHKVIQNSIAHYEQFFDKPFTNVNRRKIA